MSARRTPPALSPAPRTAARSSAPASATTAPRWRWPACSPRPIPAAWRPPPPKRVRPRGAPVRPRGDIGPRGPAPPHARALPDEPYIPVRAETARVLALLGGRRSAPPLIALWRRETELPVLA